MGRGARPLRVASQVAGSREKVGSDQKIMRAIMHWQGIQEQARLGRRSMCWKSVASGLYGVGRRTVGEITVPRQTPNALATVLDDARFPCFADVEPSLGRSSFRQVMIKGVASRDSFGRAASAARAVKTPTLLVIVPPA